MKGTKGGANEKTCVISGRRSIQRPKENGRWNKAVSAAFSESDLRDVFVTLPFHIFILPHFFEMSTIVTKL